MSGMSLVPVAASLALILVAGCAAPKPVEFAAVPGPSHSAGMLPSALTPAPAPAEKRRPAPAKKSKPAPAPPPAIVTADVSLCGKVTSYKEGGRFVVLEFPIAHLPVVGQRLFVYRNALKVGEVKVTGPQRDDHTVADLTTGEAQAGDEVREQ